MAHPTAPQSQVSGEHAALEVCRKLLLPSILDVTGIQCMRGSRMQKLWKEFVVASRMLLKAPVVAAAVIMTLAFGIATNTIAFSLVNSFFLRPLPVQELKRYSSFASGFQYLTMSYPDYADMRQLTAVC
jgi:hypothetical protein